MSRQRDITVLPHEHWFVVGRAGEQCVYCGARPEESKEELHEDG